MIALHEEVHDAKPLGMGRAYRAFHDAIEHLRPQRRKAYAGASLDVLSVLRTHRALRLGSSVPESCRPDLAFSAAAIARRVPTAEDARALTHYGTTELRLAPAATPHDVLAAVARPSLLLSPLSS